MDWFPLALLSAFSLATTDAVMKRYLSDYSARELVMVRFAYTGIVLAPLVILVPLPPVPLVFWAWITVLVPLEVLAMLLYVTAIRDAPLALTLPYLSFTPVFIALTGWLVLGETVSLRGLGGIVMVVAGAWLLNRQLATNRGAWFAPFQAIVTQRGSRLMLAVAFIYSITSVVSKGAMQYVTPLTFGPFYFFLIGVVMLITFSVTGGTALREVLWRRPKVHFIIGCTMGIMVITHFLALALVEVAYMISVKRTSMLFGIIYGALWFGEKRIRQHLTATTLMLFGVLVIVI